MSKNRIDITEQEAIDLKENITEEEKDLLKNAVKKEIRKKHRKKTKYMKAAAVAACVLIVAPTTIYGKEIQRFFQSKWKQNIFRMEVQVTKEKKSKQNVSLDTRNLKQYEVTKEKSKNETWYAFKNQKINNKDFYARLIKVDQTIKKKFFVNDVEKYSEEEISGNKVLILSMNNIDGKKDHKVYIFYEKEGYILEIPSCELSKNQILNTVKNITVQECSKKDADKGISLTKYLKEQKGIKENKKLLSKQSVAKKQEVSKGYEDGITYQIQKIKVCDSVKGLSSENKKWRNNNAQSQLRKITDKKGKLESYQRKTIIYGDGFRAPEQRIGKTQTMNQKLVFVELKVTNTTKETKQAEAAPGICFAKEKQKGYEILNDDYKRATAISKLQTNEAAAYFEESNGGYGYGFKSLKAGESEVYHLGYFVDEDQVENMSLNFYGRDKNHRVLKCFE